ncbi:hypothetical protein ACIGPN_28680 [Streptomyces afghaniensis]|uniref:hypothetical protein n=1 Tax=Streptomyces afghaniensis TaxID=66865 RepID=UPI0037D8AC58
MADQLRAWVRVMRGCGRFEHPPAHYRRIRHYLCIAWPALTSWAAAGEDLRQLTADDVRAELARHQGNPLIRAAPPSFTRRAPPGAGPLQRVRPATSHR